MIKSYTTWWSTFHEQVSHGDKVLIAPHIRVDGDALGSSLALALALEFLGYRTEVWIDELIPDLYRFMPELDRVHIMTERSMLDGDALIVVDCHEQERLGKRAVLWNQITTRFILDHHQCEALPEGVYAFVESERSSSSEMVFELIKAMENQSGKAVLSKDMAFLIACGIYTDTGGLRYSNTGVRTYDIMAEIRSLGVAIDHIAESVFSSLSLGEFRARGLAFMKTRFECEGRLAWCFFQKREILATGVQEDELGAISSLMRMVNGVDLALFMREEEKEGESSVMHLSIRSTEECDSLELAKRLGGGGHLRAAGATVPIVQDVYFTVEEILKEARLILEEK